MTEKSIQDMLNELQNSQVDKLESKILDLTERVYPNMPAAIRQTSKIIDIPEELLVRACVHAAYHYNNMQWYEVMDIVRSVFLAKRNIEEKKKEESNGTN